MTASKNICVFCGSSDNVPSLYKELAEQCGKWIGNNKHSLIYGGSSRGMMGVVARATKNANGKVVGIFPNTILSEIEVFNSNVDESIVVDSLHYRKKKMIERSDLFITLPGGTGTLDEFFEILTLKNLGVDNKPLILVNMNNYWQSLINLINNLQDTGFSSPQHYKNVTIVNNLDELFTALDDIT